MRIALIGNPNVGKSSVFNRLTGESQQVGNWSGKTVEVASATMIRAGYSVELVDLPGIYSLSAYSREEIVTRQYLLEEPPDASVLILDAAHLERNLYLALAIAELTPRLVIGLNMMEKASSLGRRIDLEQLSPSLGITVIEINAATGQGLGALLDAAIGVALLDNPPPVVAVPYPPELEDWIKETEKALFKHPSRQSRWLTMKVMEGDGISHQGCCHETGENQVDRLTKRWVDEGWTAERFELALADAKYRFISNLMRDFVKEDGEEREWSDQVDSWVLSPRWGYFILTAVLLLVFLASFVVSAPLGRLVGQAMTGLGSYAGAGLEWLNAPDLGQSLVRDGVFAGVGAVMGILPQIAVFYILFSFLQESGYLARVALLGDRFMQMWGLPGKSFFPLVSSYGCNVPGVMATRTLENYQDRLITMLLIPLIPCIPRLGVMSAILGAFFPGIRGAVVMLSLLLLDIILIILSARLLRRTVIPATSSAFVMELPRYHWPTMRQVLVPAWQQTYSFLKKVWTYVLLASIVVWGLSSFPVGVPLDQTWAGKIGAGLAVIGGQLGFDWRIMIALLFGFTAKETTLSTLGILYGVTDGTSQSISASITEVLTLLGAYTFLAVYMLYVPCLSTVVTIYKESGSLRWTGLGLLYDLILGFTVGWIIWNGGQFVLAHL